MSEARESEARQAAGPFRCECGNLAERGGFYPCDSEGHRLASSPLVCCDRCGKITVRETGEAAGHRSFALPA